MRADYRYQSRVFFDIFEDHFANPRPANVVNARLTFEAREGGWFVAVFGRNLVDELVAQNKIWLDGSTGNFQFWTALRTVGFVVGLRR